MVGSELFVLNYCYSIEINNEPKTYIPNSGARIYQIWPKNVELRAYIPIFET